MCVAELCPCVCFFFFFLFNETATTEIYTLSLHDALPIYHLEPDTDAIKEYSGSDRLLRLDATGWSNVRLPRNWLHGATAILVPNDDDPTQSPSIVSHHLDDRGATIRWHTHTGPSERWTAQDFPLNSSLPFRTALIDGQVVVAQPLDQTAPFTVQLMQNGRAHQ